MRVLVIIPAYNVSEHICDVLSKIPLSTENVIVVNDNSTDDTYIKVRSLGFNCITHEINKGMGAALKTGIKYGLSKSFSHAIFLDGDNQHDPRLIQPVIKLLKKYDFVLGNRFDVKKSHLVPSCKISSNLFGAIIVNKCLGTNFLDISCGFRGIKLSDKLLHIPGERYDYVFKQLVYVINSGMKYTTLKVPTIYPINELLGTRLSEIVSFQQVMSPYTGSFSQIEKLTNEIKNKRDFRINIEDIDFYGFYVPEREMYIIQSDLFKMNNYCKRLPA